MISEIEKQNIIKSILNIRCREGSTIADIEGELAWRFIKRVLMQDGEFLHYVHSIQDDYEEITGEPLLNAYICLNTIDCVYYDVYSNGTPKWYVKSDNVQHITKMIMEQRFPQQQQHQQPQRKPRHGLNESIKSGECFFKDNIIYKLR